MIRIKNAQYGIIPYGSGLVGDRAFALTFEEFDDKENHIDYETLSQEQMIQQVQKELLDAQKKFPNAFQHYTDAQLYKIQFLIMGTCFEKNEYRNYATTMMEEISRQSLQKQKDVKWNKLRVPWFWFIGAPVEYTRERMFYESFNYLLIHCPLRNSKNEILTNENNDIYKPFALIECMNHRAGICIFPVNSLDELPVIKNVYLTNADEWYIMKQCAVFPQNKEIASEVAKFALENGIRYASDITCDNEHFIKIEY